LINLHLAAVTQRSIAALAPFPALYRRRSEAHLLSAYGHFSLLFIAMDDWKFAAQLPVAY
jgi:hypothetical protein